MNMSNVIITVCDCVCGLPRWRQGKEPACQCRRLGGTVSVPVLGRLPGEGHGNPQYSCLEHHTDRGAWQAMVHRVEELDTTELTRHTQHLGDKKTNKQTNKNKKNPLQIVLIGLFQILSCDSSCFSLSCVSLSVQATLPCLIHQETLPILGAMA